LARQPDKAFAIMDVLDKPFYYLDNFERVLDWIVERYSDLLVPEEGDFIASFRMLPKNARALLVRMVMRKGSLFRASKLNYPEIGCARAAARALSSAGWVDTDPVLTLDALFTVLSKPELGAVFALSAHEQGASKAIQRAALRRQFGQPRAFSAWYGNSGDCLFHILVKPLCERLRLIFFGNLQQDWTEFVLSDLGLCKYETVDFSVSSRAFRSRHDMDHYLELQHCRERLLGGLAATEVVRALPPRADDNPWLASEHERLVFQIARHCEQRGDWRQAYALYARCALPGARARAIRVLEKDAQFGAAWRLHAAALRAPENEAERQQLLRIGPRLARQVGQPITRARRRAPPARLDLSLAPSAGAGSVETVVRDYLTRPEAPVFYVENALINALFGLLCWRAIFSAIPGAFFHPFHRAPADLLSADFAARRAPQFAACLEQLDSERYRATIARNFIDKHGIESPFLDWGRLSAELIALALDCIPATHLRQWSERILQDIKSNRSGFPDLIQFWPGERRYRMIEVKGPGDRLQDNQLRWIEYCSAHAMPVAVCYLRWAPPPTAPAAR
jgi:hypothetical protein